MWCYSTFFLHRIAFRLFLAGIVAVFAEYLDGGNEGLDSKLGDGRLSKYHYRLLYCRSDLPLFLEAC